MTIINAQSAYNLLNKTGRDSYQVDTKKYKTIKDITYQKHGEGIKKIVEKKDRKVYESVFDKSGKLQSIYAYKKPMLNWNYGDTFLFSKNFNYKEPSRVESFVKHLKIDCKKSARTLKKTLREIFK